MDSKKFINHFNFIKNTADSVSVKNRMHFIEDLINVDIMNITDININEFVFKNKEKELLIR